MSENKEVDMVKFIIIPPNQEPQIAVMKNEDRTFEIIVGGYIQFANLKDTLCLILNLEGKLYNLETNRILEERKDFIVGTFCVVNIDPSTDNVISLTDEQVSEVFDIFKLDKHIEKIEYINEMKKDYALIDIEFPEDFFDEEEPSI